MVHPPRHCSTNVPRNSVALVLKLVFMPLYCFLVCVLSHGPWSTAAASTGMALRNRRTPTTNKTNSQYFDYKIRRLNPNSGKINVLIVLVSFTNHNDRDLPSPSYFDDLWSNDIARWFELNSNGNYQIEAVVTEWFESDNTEAFYAGGASGATGELQQAFWPALNALDSTGSWDWSQFDSNNDGKLDSVVFLHSGYAAEQINNCETGVRSVDRLWSRGFGGVGRNDDTWSSQDNSYSLDGFLVAPALDGGTCGPAAIGTMIHEYIHTLDGAIPDLYDTSTQQPRGNGVGAFDIMGYLYGPKNNPMLPGHLSAWAKKQLGWLNPTQIFFDGVYTLQPAEITDDAFIIRFGFMPPKLFEYLLFENRQQIEFDADLWSNGLVIYHVDDFANKQNSRGYPGQTGWPENGNHYQVAVLQADGNYELELGSNRGDATDFWAPGMVLGPGQGNAVFPNTDSYQGGIIEESGIKITVLPAPSPDLVQFRVDGLRPAPPTNSPKAPPPVIPTALPPVRPTLSPTTPPTSPPTIPPTAPPTLNPTSPPTTPPTALRSNPPSNLPTTPPTIHPTSPPTIPPTVPPSDPPSNLPTSPPITPPTALPSNPPLFRPTTPPTIPPTSPPTIPPIVSPSNLPTSPPTTPPTALPSNPPSFRPTTPPNIRPTSPPATPPTVSGSNLPANRPTTWPSEPPTNLQTRSPPTEPPTNQPSNQPTSKVPTMTPSLSTRTPTGPPTNPPTTTNPLLSIPSNQPTNSPTELPKPGPITFHALGILTKSSASEVSTDTETDPGANMDEETRPTVSPLITNSEIPNKVSSSSEVTTGANTIFLAAIVTFFSMRAPLWG